jgi:O-antigen/teichoic acid export membrane protein
MPLLPAALSLWILDRADRFFIGYYQGAKEVGIYSACYALGGLVIQAQMPFQMTLFPKVAQLWDVDRPAARRYIELSNKFFLSLAIPFTIACAVMAPRLLKKLGNEEISANSALLTVLVSAGVTLYGVSVMQIQILHGARRTVTQGVVHVGAAVLNVALNVILLPRIGTVGAAIATLVAYGASCVALAKLAHAHMPISYFPLYLAKSVAASALMLLPMMALAQRGTAGIFGAIAAGIPTYFGALVLLRAFNAEEVAIVKSGWRKLRGKGETEHAGPP